MIILRYKFLAYESKLEYIFIILFLSRISTSTLLIYRKIIAIKCFLIINLVNLFLETYILNAKRRNI